MEHSTVSLNSTHSTRWSTLCGKFPKEEIIYFCQVLAIYIIISVCLVQLSFADGKRDSLWSSLLGSSIGYLLPAPFIGKKKKKKNDTFLSDSTG